MNLNREPAFYIGLAVTIVLGVITTLAGEGIINDAVKGQITDGVNALAQLAVLLAPVIAGLLIRPNVTPVAAPAVPEGTVVTVQTPAGQADKRVTV